MTKPVPPWEPGTRQTTIAPAKPRRRHAPASEAHKRGLTLDWLSTTPDARPALLRRIVGAEYNSRYTGRTAILDEVADAAYESAEDKDDLDGLLTTIAADLQARKDGAALLNQETPPGVRGAIIAKRYQLGKTEPVRFGGEQTVPRDNKSPRQPELVPEAPKPTLTGGLFGTKPADPQDNIDTFTAPNPEVLTAGLDIAHGTPAEREAAREHLAPAADNSNADNDNHIFNHILARLADHYSLDRQTQGAQLAEKVRAVFGLPLDKVPAVYKTLKAVDAELDAFFAKPSTVNAAPANPPEPVTMTAKQEDKPTMTPPALTEASVIVFAKSDIFVSLPNGASVTLSVTLRDGAQFEEVKRLIDVYKQMLSLPGVSVSRAQPAPAVVPRRPNQRRLHSRPRHQRRRRPRMVAPPMDAAMCRGRWSTRPSPTSSGWT